ncbi:MAG: hypothetical protein AABZ15_11395 [Nitrospirota bacterium]
MKPAAAGSRVDKRSQQLPQVGLDQQWHYQASAQVDQPGLIETVLPAGVFFGTDGAARTSQLDLTLVGPDGNPRSFELFWKGDTGPRSVALKPSRLLFDKKRMLVWEADGPKDLLVETVRIDVDAPQTMGTVKIEGLDAKGWHVLAENAALYASGGRFAAEISVKQGIYQKLRLGFKGYDKRFRETTLPVTSVTLSGKNAAQDFAQLSVPLKFSDKTDEHMRVLSTTLPGPGLWIKHITLTTEAQFQGAWELGAEVVSGGKLQFQKLLSGSVTTVGKKGSLLEIPVAGYWATRSLVLRLDPGKTYVGAIKSMAITVNLPRMTFYADKAGSYLAQTGLGSLVAIQETPGDKERKISAVVAFSDAQENPQWQPESLLKKYAVAGGPFDGKGFRWQSRLPVGEAGYYRLVLNREASLRTGFGTIRIVKDGVQVPYFSGPSEERVIALAATPEYDKKKNRTTWTVELPDRSTDLRELSVESAGIFDRVVQIEAPLQGRAGWQVWRTMRWQNATQTPSVLRVPLAGLPLDVAKLRIAMEHGDNRPIELGKPQASYGAPVLLFLASAAGEFALYGGNDTIGAAKYDLTLVQAHLADVLPKTVEMGKVESVSSAGFKNAFVGAFEDKSWGLYAVLGGVTLILMIVIARLFPKAEQ